MGWELRGGRRYLYRNHRVNGKPVKEYLAADDPFGFGAQAAAGLAREQLLASRIREGEQQTVAVLRSRVDHTLAAAGAANAALRVIAEGILTAVGFHRHNRGEWRMHHALKRLGKQIDQLGATIDKLKPQAGPPAPPGDAEAADLFARARAGDAAAQGQLRGLIATRGWTHSLGDLGRQATLELIRAAAGGDPVREAGITEAAATLQCDLLGPCYSALDLILVRRVVNGWVTVHALELELAGRPAAEQRSRDYVDKALTRAQKRMTDAARELARVRRLALPAVLAQVTVVAPAATEPLRGLSPRPVGVSLGSATPGAPAASGMTDCPPEPLPQSVEPGVRVMATAGSSCLIEMTAEWPPAAQ